MAKKLTHIKRMNNNYQIPEIYTYELTLNKCNTGSNNDLFQDLHISI